MPTEHSDQQAHPHSLCLSALKKKQGSMATHNVSSKDSDQIAWVHRLIWVSICLNSCLTLCMLGKTSADDILKYFLIFSRKYNLTLHANCLPRRQFA